MEAMLTVFTPTYNRKKLLLRVYESLLAQSSHELKWLIVDDGSADGTRESIEELKKEAPFEILYHYRENGGKMRAHNMGTALCDTELFVCLDSDDIFTPTAVETITKKWRAFKDCHFCMKQSAERAGIVAYKGIINGSSGTHFPGEIIERGYSTLRGLYLGGFKGETTLVFRTELLKKYPFPEIEGEKYVPEDYIYDKIDGECPLLVVDEVFTQCELMDGGYTDQAARLRRENPVGWLLYYEQRYKLKSPPLLKLKYMSHYLIFCRITGRRHALNALQLAAALPGALALRLLGKT